MFLTDGYQTLISLGIGIISLREREVQPPDFENGEIDTTTMRNGVSTLGAVNMAWRSKAPKYLTTFGDITAQCQWNPLLLNTLGSYQGFITTVQIRFPDASGMSYQGWLDSFKPASMKEGEFPLAEIKIKASMITPVDGSATRQPIMAVVTYFPEDHFLGGAPL